MAQGDFVGATPGSGTVFVGVGSRATFDAIPLPAWDHRNPVGGNKPSNVLTKSIDADKAGGYSGVPLERTLTVVFQHWLDGAQP